VTQSRTCEYCGGYIPSDRPISRFCSDKCRGESWRKANGWDHTKYVVIRRLRRRHWLDRYKIAKGCAECGYNEAPEALHFDHIDPSNKRNIVSGMYGYKLKTLMEEVRKCRVLCANCHAIHSTRQQRNG